MGTLCRQLAKAAGSQPQAAFAALSKSVQFEWRFLQRVIPNCSALFSLLEDAIHNIFWSSLFGGPVSKAKRELFSLPTMMAGLGVRDPVSMASKVFFGF